MGLPALRTAALRPGIVHASLTGFSPWAMGGRQVCGFLSLILLFVFSSWRMMNEGRVVRLARTNAWRVQRAGGQGIR